MGNFPLTHAQTDSPQSPIAGGHRDADGGGAGLEMFDAKWQMAKVRTWYAAPDVWTGDQPIEDQPAAMIVEPLPEVLALPTAQKEMLAEELLNQVVLEEEKDPALLELLRQRLAEHAAEPESGVPWAVSRGRLLKTRLAFGAPSH